MKLRDFEYLDPEYLWWALDVIGATLIWLALVAGVLRVP